MAQVVTVSWPNSVTAPAFCVHPHLFCAAQEHVILAALAAFGPKQSGSVQMSRWCLGVR